MRFKDGRKLDTDQIDDRGHSSDLSSRWPLKTSPNENLHNAIYALIGRQMHQQDARKMLPSFRPHKKNPLPPRSRLKKTSGSSGYSRG